MRHNSDRWAFKHAHSRVNPEASWDIDVIQSIRFAFWALNDHLDGHFRPDNTIVIASSVSNGGGASLRAAERAPRGLIDGVAVSEPNVNPTFDPRFVIQQGGAEPIAKHSRSLFDYTTLLNVFQGCANRAPANLAAPLSAFNDRDRAESRCEALAQKGLVRATNAEIQAIEAQQIINDAGFLIEQNIVQPAQWFLSVPQAIAATYANAYARSSVTAELCGYGFAAVDQSGSPAPLHLQSELALFGNSNGIPPTAGLALINEKSTGGPKNNVLSTSPSTGFQDENLDGALCLRALQLGVHPATGEKLTGQARRAHERIQAGIKRVLATGNLKGTPTIIVQGRADGILPPNHTSRPYFGLNRLREGKGSRLSYVEVLNANHLDALNGFGFANFFVPLHHYFLEALDILYAHLTDGTPLPPSQVVRTVPRVGNEALSEANLPPIVFDVAAGDQIRLANGVLHVPD